jgi:hypothetical protein
MKVKALIDCIGLGYNLKKEDEAELSDALANKLIKFGYVEVLDNDSSDENQNSTINNNENLDSNDENTILTIDDLPHKSGWYELPNGEKVQGKENAELALKELQGSDD